MSTKKFCGVKKTYSSIPNDFQENYSYRNQPIFEKDKTHVVLNESYNNEYSNHNPNNYNYAQYRPAKPSSWRESQEEEDKWQGI